MNEMNFERFRRDRRNKITVMDTIIRNNDEFKEGEKDVLLRGFIVLIYAFWEGNYKKIQDIFFEILKEKKLSELPHKIKNRVIIDLVTTKKERNKKIVEIEDYNQITGIHSKITDALEKNLSSYEECNKLKQHFRENSNNPSFLILENMLSKYNMSLRRIVNELIQEEAISEDFEKRLEFIIGSRNSIAHGAENDLENFNDYEEVIISKFISKDEPTIIDVSSFLNETAFYIDLLYNQIYNEFLNKYMHEEEKVI